MSNEVCHRYESPDGVEVLICVHCPACGYDHPFRIKGDGPTWSWNGDMLKPTFTPSMRCAGGTPKECHSNVTDGNIAYHGDCWHDKKGQTVPLTPYDE